MCKLRILCLVSVLGALSAIGVASPAQAHDTCAATHGSDYACVTNSHSIIWACDGESDGHGVKAHSRDATFNIDAYNWDLNGADPGCSQDPMPTSEIEFRICENEVGCSGWVYE